MSAAPKVDHGNVLADKEFINAFIQSVVSTHKITVGVDLIPGKAHIIPKLEKHGEVTGFVGIVSRDMKWILSLSYESKTAFKLYQTMFAETKDKLDNEVRDLIGEITNQVYGGAKTVLNQRGFSFEMALPTVISGDFKTSHHGGGVTLCVPFTVSGSNEPLWVDITLEK